MMTPGVKHVINHKRAKLELRLVTVAKMILHGATIQQIAAATGVSTPTVIRDRRRVIERWRRDQCPEERKIWVARELAKMSELEMIATSIATGAPPDGVSPYQLVYYTKQRLKAIDSIVRLMERRAALIGLDEPKQATVTVEAVSSEDVRTRVMAALDRQEAARVLASGPIIDVYPTDPHN